MHREPSVSHVILVGRSGWAAARPGLSQADRGSTRVQKGERAPDRQLLLP